MCSWYTQGQVFEGICSTFSHQGYHYSLIVHGQVHRWHQFCVPQLCRHSTWICEWTMLLNLFHTHTLHVVTHYGTVCQLHVIPWKRWMLSTLQLRWCLVYQSSLAQLMYLTYLIMFYGMQFWSLTYIKLHLCTDTLTQLLWQLFLCKSSITCNSTGVSVWWIHLMLYSIPWFLLLLWPGYCGTVCGSLTWVPDVHLCEETTSKSCFV